MIYIFLNTLGNFIIGIKQTSFDARQMLGSLL